MTSVLVRYGAMGEVARFACPEPPAAGTAVVVRTARGEELGTVVAPAADVPTADGNAPAVLRPAAAADRAAADRRRAECETEFVSWQGRIDEWGVDLQLIDAERTLDGGKLILYVLNNRGPETTKLALKAAAAGFGVIEVQPVGPEGPIRAASGGCGSCRH